MTTLSAQKRVSPEAAIPLAYRVMESSRECDVSNLARNNYSSSLRVGLDTQRNRLTLVGPYDRGH